MTPYEKPEYDQEVAALREQMDADALESNWQVGRGMSVEQAVAYATGAADRGRGIESLP